MIFYAATAGALVDLAADLGWRLDLRDDVVLDGHPRPGEAHQVTSGLRELSVVQRALGMLIARGRTPHAARRELEQARPGIGHRGRRGRRGADPRRRPGPGIRGDRPAEGTGRSTAVVTGDHTGPPISRPVT